MTTSAPSEASARDLTAVSLSLDSSELAEKYDTLSNLQLANGKYLVGELGIRRGQRVLDIGAGTGRLAEYVAKVVDDPTLVSAIDPLPLRIALARRKLGSQAKLVVGRAEDLSAFGDSSSITPTSTLCITGYPTNPRHCVKRRAYSSGAVALASPRATKSMKM